MKRTQILSIVWLSVAFAGAAEAQSEAPAPARDEAPAQAPGCYPEVSPEERQAAQALANEAFELHKQLQFNETAETYRRALAHWQRPDIHLQAGIAFLSALRLLEAHEHIKEALRCGRGVLSAEDYEEAGRMMQRLQARLAEVEVHCDEPGAVVLFNDEPWFTGVATQTRVVVAGQYLIKVDKPGYVPVLKPVTVKPGERVVVEPRMMTVAEATVASRRWKVWQPWAVAGAGVALGLAGTALQWGAGNEFAEYDRMLATLCNPRCTEGKQLADAAIRDKLSAATWKNRLAIGAFVAGSAALVSGVTWAFFNPARTSTRPEAGSAGTRVIPMVTPEAASLSVSRTF